MVNLVPEQTTVWENKESEKRDKYLDFAKEQIKFENVREAVIPNKLSAFGKVVNDLEKGLED